jgi:(2Fe-2S) ferredoxin
MDKNSLPHRKIVFVCVNERPPEDRVCCTARNGVAIRNKLKSMVKERKLAHLIRVSQSGCMDKCEQGANVMIFPDNIWYSHVEESDCEALLEELITSLGSGVNAPATE